MTSRTTAKPASRPTSATVQLRVWQRMLSGRRLDLLDPSPLDVEIADIAHGLAGTARPMARISFRWRSTRCWWKPSCANTRRASMSR
jgi:hypothetical protein